MFYNQLKFCVYTAVQMVGDACSGMWCESMSKCVAGEKGPELKQPVQGETFPNPDILFQLVKNFIGQPLGLS